MAKSLPSLSAFLPAKKNCSETITEQVRLGRGGAEKNKKAEEEGN